LTVLGFIRTAREILAVVGISSKAAILKRYDRSQILSLLRTPDLRACFTKPSGIAVYAISLPPFGHILPRA
jgi:hypothetical protein